MLNDDAFKVHSRNTEAWAELTPRQREIAALIAQGYTNRDIGDRLCIQPGTVANHVADILGRLGFSSRTQVAAWAVRHAAVVPNSPTLRLRWSGRSIVRSGADANQPGLAQMLLENMPEPLLVVERGARYYTFANAAAASALGYTLKELLRLGPPDLTSNRSLPALLDAFTALSSEGRWRGKWRLRCKDGRTISTDASVAVVTLGERVIYQGIFRIPDESPAPIQPRSAGHS